MRTNKVFVNVVYVMISKTYGAEMISYTYGLRLPIVVSNQILTIIDIFDRFKL